VGILYIIQYIHYDDNSLSLSRPSLGRGKGVGSIHHPFTQLVCDFAAYQPLDEGVTQFHCSTRALACDDLTILLYERREIV
jgi:hypothetical protein